MITDSEKNPVTLRALLPGSKTGTLIGKGGQVHKHIQAMFDVKIYFQPGRESPMRLVSAFGHPDNVAKFWREALLRMYASRPFDLNYGCGQVKEMSRMYIRCAFVIDASARNWGSTFSFPSL